MVELVRPKTVEIRPDPVPGGFQFPVVTLLPTGNFAAIWAGFGNAEDANGAGVKGQILDQAGNRVGNAFVVNNSATYNQYAPATAVFASGEFVVAWADIRYIYAQRFKSDGTKLGDEITVSEITNFSGAPVPKIASLPGGGFVVADTSTGDISAKLFQTDGTLFKTIPIDIENYAAVEGVVALSGGDFALLWTEQTLTASEGIKAQLFDAAGNARGDVFRVDSAPLEVPGFLASAALDSGGLVVSWVVFGENGGIRARRIDSSGNKVGDEIHVSSLTPNHQTNPTIITFAWGGFVIAWEDSSPGLNLAGSQLRAQLFDADGSKLGDEFSMNVQDHWERYPQLAAISASEFIVHWVDGGDVHGQGTSGLTQRTFTLPQLGTTLADTMTGTNGGDAMAGRAGDDTINGQGGNDNIEGGSGRDKMIGGAGNDLYAVDNAGDIVLEDPGGGNDSVVASVDFGLADNVENLTLGGTAELNGAGNDGSNVLTGNGAINSLSASKGNDTLIGGGGNDELDGGSGIDTAVFSGPRSAYVVESPIAGHMVISGGTDGQDQLSDIEVLRFSDGNFAWDAALAKLISLDDAAHGYRLIAPDKFNGRIAGTGRVFGASGSQEIAIIDLPGTTEFDGSFNRGGDVVRLSGLPEMWQVRRSGSSAELTNGYTSVVIPVGTAGMSVVMEGGGPRTLIYDTESATMKLGGQTVSDAFAVVEVPTSPYLPALTDPDVSATLVVPVDNSVSVRGNFDIFATAGREHITLAEGNFTFDASFNRGGDTVTLLGSASEYTAVRKGSSVSLSMPGINIVIPVGVVGMTLDFDDGDWTVRYDAALESIVIGNQPIQFASMPLSQLA